METRETGRIGASRSGGAEGSARFTRRVVAYAFGIELPYSLLVPVAYLRLFGIDDPREQSRVLALIGALYAVKTLLLVALLVRMLRPVERLRRQAALSTSGAADGASKATEPLILQAGKAAYETPLAFATSWAFAWLFLYVPVTAALPALAPHRGPLQAHHLVALGLFSLACFAAALPLAYSILGRLLSPAAGSISLMARKRGLAVPGRSFSLAVRLVVLSVCLAGAPTSWMASMVVALPQRPAAASGAWVTLFIFALVAVAWAPVCAGFLAGALAGPFRQVGSVIETIVRRGDAERLEWIPIHFKDEIGALAAGLNAMVDRLQESSARIQSYVAERERLREDAAQRAAQLQAVLDNLVEGVFACDAEGRLTLVNASGLRLLGLASAPNDRLSIDDLHDLGRIRHPDGRPFSRAELPMVRALAGETIAQEEQILVQQRPQTDVFLRTSAAPIRDEQSAILGAVAVARDVTELRELDLVKDQFIRVGAHELKTPVAIMKGYALAMLRNVTDLSPGRRRMLEAIDRGADRINRIVDDLLAISQISLDVLSVNNERIDLSRLVKETVDRVARTCTRHRLSLSVKNGRSLVARGDPERLRQVLASLLDNAVKYSPDGGDILVTVSDAGSGRDRRAVRHAPDLEAVVSVQDRGVGIPVSKQGRIFERFFRAHTDTPHDYGGMGVGLFLAKDMITRQGGRMWFESEEHQGSTFHFTVPLERGEASGG